MNTKITYIGHAMVLFERDGQKLLTDPWFADSINFEGLFAYPPLPQDKEMLASQVDFIHISHIHHDHFCRKTLQLFKRSTPIIIADYEDKLFYREIKKLGFLNIIEIKEGQSYPAGPFRLTSYISWPQDRSFDSAIVLSTQEENIFLNNDCILSDEAYIKIKKQFKNFSGGFLGYSGVSPFPTCYQFLNSETPADTYLSASKKFYLDHFFRVSKILEFDWIGPYANGLRCLKPELLKSNLTFSIFEDVQSLPSNSYLLFLEPGDSFEVPGFRNCKKIPQYKYDIESIKEYARKFDFKKYPPVTTKDLENIFSFLKNLSSRNSPVTKEPFRVNIQLDDEHNRPLAFVSMRSDGRGIFLNREILGDPDMVVVYPANLMKECALGRGLIAQIHYGFQFTVIAKKVMHDFFFVISQGSPGFKLHD